MSRTLDPAPVGMTGGVIVAVIGVLLGAIAIALGGDAGEQHVIDAPVYASSCPWVQP